MAAEAAELPRVVLSWPSLVRLNDGATPALRSWIQVACTGSFVSSRYGQFSISRDDLAQMVTNFNEVTPKAPTELPIDYDHLSMDPKKPGDGVAAGWMKRLELRDEGTALWADVEWTAEAADAIREKKYRFVSPSFVKNYRHKDGTHIGTTLLAAAITNHPFLEGMQALTLYNFSVMGDLALVQMDDRVVHLAQVGQHVALSDDPEQTPELTDEERRQTFTVKAVIGAGEDEFVRLTTADGQEFGWFRVTQLVPAGALANPMPTEPSNKAHEESQAMHHDLDPDHQLVTLANAIAAQHGLSLRDATIEASRQRPDLAAARRAAIGVEATETIPTPAPVHNLHRQTDEGFAALCLRIAHDRQIDLRDACRLASEAYPELAEAYARGEF
jgi:hypothetical protein